MGYISGGGPKIEVRQKWIIDDLKLKLREKYPIFFLLKSTPKFKINEIMGNQVLKFQ